MWRRSQQLAGKISWIFSDYKTWIDFLWNYVKTLSSHLLHGISLCKSFYWSKWRFQNKSDYPISLWVRMAKRSKHLDIFREYQLENLTWRQGRSSLINVVCFKYWRAVGNMPVAGLLSERTTFRSRHMPDFYVQSGAFCSDVLSRAKLFNISHIF